MVLDSSLGFTFDADTVKENIINWIKDWFDKNGKGCPAVLGISGGKDSSVVAALCAEALGPQNVIGVMMPNGAQKDIEMAKKLISHLGIKSMLVDIKPAYDALLGGVSQASLANGGPAPRRQAIVNLSPRLRMATLYAVCQTYNGRVANTSNLSEAWVGYTTRYGDNAGDFSPLRYLVVAEVKALAHALGLPFDLAEKTPDDGISGKTDEENLGFTYAVLDKYIRTGVCDEPALKAKIDALHAANAFKSQPVPAFGYE